MGNSKSKPQPVANKLPDQPQERSDAVSQGPPPRNTPRERLPSGPPPRRTSPIIVHSKHSPPRLEIRHPASPREENTTRPSTNQTPATNERSPRGTSTSDIVWKEAQLIDGYPDREALHEMCSKMYGKGNFRVKVHSNPFTGL